jgi:hypothetical protein
MNHEPQEIMPPKSRNSKASEEKQGETTAPDESRSARAPVEEASSVRDDRGRSASSSGGNQSPRDAREPGSPLANDMNNVLDSRRDEEHGEVF